MRRALEVAILTRDVSLLVVERADARLRTVQRVTRVVLFALPAVVVAGHVATGMSWAQAGIALALCEAVMWLVTRNEMALQRRTSARALALLRSEPDATAHWQRPHWLTVETATERVAIVVPEPHVRRHLPATLPPARALR